MEGAKYFFHKRKAEKHTKMSFFCDVWLKSTGQAKDVAAGESAMVTGSTEQNPNLSCVSLPAVGHERWNVKCVLSNIYPLREAVMYKCSTKKKKKKKRFK